MHAWREGGRKYRTVDGRGGLGWARGGLDVGERGTCDVRSGSSHRVPMRFFLSFSHGQSWRWENARVKPVSRGGSVVGFPRGQEGAVLLFLSVFCLLAPQTD